MRFVTMCYRYEFDSSYKRSEITTYLQSVYWQLEMV